MNYLLKKAIYYATEKHNGQYRKGGKIPYIAHPQHVAFTVRHYTDNPDIICAAVLHDVIEDCNVTREELEREFSKSIADLVQEVSLEMPNKLLPWREKKQAYIGKLNSLSNDALLIIAADKMTNMESYFEALELMPGEVKKEFGGSKEDYYWYYEEVQKILEEGIGKHPVVKDYGKLFASLKEKTRNL